MPALTPTPTPTPTSPPTLAPTPVSAPVPAPVEISAEGLTEMIATSVATAIAKAMPALTAPSPQAPVATPPGEVAETFGELMGKFYNPLPLKAQAKQEFDKGIGFARYCRALAAGKAAGSGLQGAAFYAANVMGDGVMATHIAKSLSWGVNASGGFLVPEDFIKEMIELLRVATVVRGAGPIMMPMPDGNVTVPKMAGGASANYIAELANIPKSEQTFSQVTMTAKKLAALTPISNTLIRKPSAEADAIVRDDLVLALATREDLAFLRGDGTNDTPVGFLNYTLAGQSDAQTALPGTSEAADLAVVRFDLGRAMLHLQNANVPTLRPTWFMAPRTAMFLLQKVDGNGNLAFPTMSSMNLYGFPVKTTTAIPINLSGTDSEIYLVDMAQFVIGDTMQITVDASTEAAYHDGSSVQAAFSRDETVIRAIAEHDTMVRHDEALAMITAVVWAP